MAVSLYVYISMPGRQKGRKYQLRHKTAEMPTHDVSKKGQHASLVGGSGRSNLAPSMNLSRHRLIGNAEGRRKHAAAGPTRTYYMRNVGSRAPEESPSKDPLVTPSEIHCEQFEFSHCSRAAFAAALHSLALP